MYEDFRTYTEVDEDNKITITVNKCDWADADTRNKNYYVCSDKSAGHFGDYDHKLDLYLDAHITTSLTGFWGVTNNLGDLKFWSTHVTDYQVVTAYGTTYDIRYRDAGQAYDIYDASSDTPYYLTIKRAGTVGTCKIYSDSARTNLLDTLTTTCVLTTYKYIYGFTGYNDETGTPAPSTGYIENLDLQEVPAVNPYPVSLLQKDVISGYHCFMQAYMNAKVGGYDPLKLPDGTVF